MSGDYSRFGFDPRSDYKGVLLQQGRPLTDRDWNDQVIMTGRRIQAGTYDTLGQAVVPSTTPNGFLLSFDGAGRLQISRGRMYVDGLLVENHGNGKAAWDPALAETYGADPVPYKAIPPATNGQPYLPNPSDLPASGGPYVAFLDVWQREVTQFEDPNLVEPALGVDTTTRLQTVWQVKLLGNVGAGVTCATPPDQLKGWTDLIAPSAGRLTTVTGDVAGQVNPCIIPPTAGYTGLENQLYRVEIDQGGALGTATFKWSRDNASITARVNRIIDPRHVVVDSVGKDDVLRFSDGDWIEITDDWRELNGQPGEMRKITVGDGVNDATRTITLDQPITAGLFPADASGNTDPTRHTRIRRWDQQGKVLDKDGNVYVDLDAGTAGVITTAVGTSLLLENGILVTFSLDPAGGMFHSGDYWVFAARASNGTIEILNAAPPRGIHHHYAKLAVITFPDTIANCRIPWPPTQGAGDCACTRCVTPEGHADGSYTLQKAIDEVIGNGGTVCLHEGKYRLDAPLKIQKAQSLHVKGQGTATVLEAVGGAFVISASNDVSLSDFAIEGRTVPENGAIAVATTTGLRLDRLTVTLQVDGTTATAIGLLVLPIEAAVRDCSITAPVGIGNSGRQAGSSDTTRLNTEAGAKLAKDGGALHLVVEDNVFVTSGGGVILQEGALPESNVLVRSNSFSLCSQIGIGILATGKPAVAAEIAGNRLAVTGTGIVAGIPSLRITGNDIVFSGEKANQHEGVMLRPLGQPPDCQIIGNRISGFGGGGIMAYAPLSAAIIKQNEISQCGAGIVLSLDGDARSGAISVENNQIEIVEPPSTAAAKAAVAAGIWIANADSAQVAGNFLKGIGTTMRDARSRIGILVAAGDRVCVASNEVTDVGPVGEFVGPSVGILVRRCTGGLAISDNLVRRFSPSVTTDDDNSDWMALVVTDSTDADKNPILIFNNADFSRLDQAFVLDKSVAVTEIDKLLVLKTTAAQVKMETVSVQAAAAPVKAEEVTVQPAAAPVKSDQAASGAQAVAVVSSVAIRGNHLEGHGRSPVALVASGADCVFSENHCVLATPDSQRASGADVMIAGRIVAAANNRIAGGRIALDIRPQSEKCFSVLGNLTLGIIIIGGNALADPWKPLNIIGV